jgi:hypothetical protein
VNERFRAGYSVIPAYNQQIMAEHTKAIIRNACISVIKDKRSHPRDKVKAAAILAAMIQQKRFSPGRTPHATARAEEEKRRRTEFDVAQPTPNEQLTDILSNSTAEQTKVLTQ